MTGFTATVATELAGGVVDVPTDPDWHCLYRTGLLGCLARQWL